MNIPERSAKGLVGEAQRTLELRESWFSGRISVSRGARGARIRGTRSTKNAQANVNYGQ
jgi:hypothetical protein